MRFSSDEAAEAVGGTVVGPDVVVDGATQDSREVRGGELFVPLVAERDGHDFVDAALAAGAAAYLTSREPVGGTAIQVDDTMAALDAIGRTARDRLPDRVVGITGSVGKTSTKDLAVAVLGRRWSTAASERSFNNEIGVPLTLANAPEGTEAEVLEMGMRGFGHLRSLAELARPTVAVVTAVELVHTEAVGDLDGVARAKGELVEALPPDGCAVLNAADERVTAMGSLTRARVARFGPGGHLCAEDVEVGDDLHATVTLAGDWGRTRARVGLAGEHQVPNALAAALTGLVLDVALDDVAAGLEAAVGSPWRMALSTAPSGLRVLNDAYNAGPASTRAALRALARLPARRRLAVLGPMAELGDHEAAEHRAVAGLAHELGLDVLAVGDTAYGVDAVGSWQDALGRLAELGEGDVVLVKASRSAGLERLAEALMVGSDGG